MNPWLTSALADSRGRELRGEAPGPRASQLPYEATAPRIGSAGAGTRPAHGVPRGSRVRHQVGFALVEAGLRLLATAPRS